ncbi:MAG TPA: flagellar motor protein MotB [Candidatus Latescibacteria bacterium]|nr:flagellar motor protein MotB [Candidatus Latescibacterota bacterium]
MKEKRGNDKGTDDSSGWTTTYGDLMTLLLTFFVLLFSFSVIELTKFRKAMGSLKGALGVLKAEESMIKIGETPYPRMSSEEAMEMRKSVLDLKKYVRLEDYDKAIYIEETGKELIINISNPIMFDLGRADLKPEIRPLLDKIAAVIEYSKSNVKIEGHTDDLPIRTSRFPSNWELSTARAVNVLRYFVDKARIDPKRLSAVGYGQYHPLFPNDSEEHRARNRRAVIRIEYTDTERRMPHPTGRTQR